MSMPSISKRPILVAPFAGAWIEIAREQPDKYFGSVAPFAGAWIEMPEEWRIRKTYPVAPFAGAWIEIRR